MPKSSKTEKKYEKVAATIKAYPKQIEQVWDEINHLYIPDDYKNIKNVALFGMGGSALGGRIVDSLVYNRLRVPFEVFNDYHLPNYIFDQSLTICSSYSGNTEETLSATHESLSRGAKIFGITTGGKLAEILKERKTPSYIFDPVNNPSGQPRFGIGYMTSAVLAILSKLEVVSFSKEELDQAIAAMNEALTQFNENAEGKTNIALGLSKKIKNKSVILVASEHLTGTAYAFKNQLNESAKTFSAIFELPELNHHLMEGLKFPDKNMQTLHFLFIQSDLYSDRVKKRYPITQKVVEENGIGYSVYKPISVTKLSQVLEVLTLGSYTTYFLGKSLAIDPLEIPWVNYFKKELAK